MNYELDMPYKGERNYLHGTDFFNKINSISFDLMKAEAFIEKLQFRKFATKMCILDDAKDFDSPRIIGSVRLKAMHSNTTTELRIIESDAPVTHRYEFDEDAISNQCLLDKEQRRVILQNRTSYTPIEEIVAVTKHLHYALNSPAQGKWVFGQLDMLQPLLNTYRSLEIQTRNFFPERFSVNEIILDNQVVGNIRFIVGVP